MLQHLYTLETYGELWMVIRVIHGALKAYPALTNNSAHYQFRSLSIQLIISVDSVKALEIRYPPISS